MELADIFHSYTHISNFTFDILIFIKMEKWT